MIRNCRQYLQWIARGTGRALVVELGSGLEECQLWLVASRARNLPPPAAGIISPVAGIFLPLLDWCSHAHDGILRSIHGSVGAEACHARHEPGSATVRMGDGLAEQPGVSLLPVGRQWKFRGMRFPLRNEARDNSDRFFSYEPVRDYRLEGNRLTFTSPVQTRYPENNTAHALWFPAPNDDGRVVIVLPQWNSGPDGHVGLARL